MATKTLSFSKNSDGKWEATESVAGDFAIHIERHASGTIQIETTSVEDTAYQSKFSTAGGLVFDQDFQCLFPKYLRILSASMPKDGDCYVIDNSEESNG